MHLRRWCERRIGPHLPISAWLHHPLPAASQLLWWGQTSHDRASSATAPRLPDTDQCSTREASFIPCQPSQITKALELPSPGGREESVLSLILMVLIPAFSLNEPAFLVGNTAPHRSVSSCAQADSQSSRSSSFRRPMPQYVSSSHRDVP